MAGPGVGRDQVAAVTITGSPAQAAERIAELGAAGADEITFALDGRDYFHQLDLLGRARALLN